VQKFECVRGEFLRGFSNTPGSEYDEDDRRRDEDNDEASVTRSAADESELKCAAEPRRRDRRASSSSYRVAFPSRRQGGTRTARENYGDWMLDFECEGSRQFVCGMTVTRTRRNAPPSVEPLCCKASGNGIDVSFSSAVSSSAATAWFVVLIILLVLLLILILVCVVNIYW